MNVKYVLRVVLLLCCAVSLAAKPVSKKGMALPDKVMQASTVYVDCVCPRALAVAKPRGLQQLQSWGRFQSVDNVREADLVILFSGNPYLSDLLTRDGPDKRPVFIESTIMTVIDARTGQRCGVIRGSGAAGGSMGPPSP
jgi:hypothetical protein